MYPRLSILTNTCQNIGPTAKHKVEKLFIKIILLQSRKVTSYYKVEKSYYKVEKLFIKTK